MPTKKKTTKPKPAPKPAAVADPVVVAPPVAEPQSQAGVIVAEAALPPAEPVPDPLKAKAEAIRAHFSDVQIDGGPVDPKNADHLTIAAYEVGRRGILRG